MPSSKPPLSRPAPGRDEMARILERSGIELTAAQLTQLWTYHQRLRRHNPELNLTRIHNFANMVLKLYVDSILPGQLMALPSPLLDLGTGPGMPGIPLKIAFPHLEVLLAESRQKRVVFLAETLEELGLEGIELIGEGISPAFERPVSGVITRAVESIGATLERVSGCLIEGGQVIFMKGPHCDEELAEALSGFGKNYELTLDRAYQIPHTPHARRLVVFTRTGAVKRRAVSVHPTRLIESEHNELFRDLRKLLAARGIKKLGKVIVSGAKQTAEVVRDFPERCEAWVSRGAAPPPPPGAPSELVWLQLAPPLFEALDQFGTGSPLLLVRIEPIAEWRPEEGLPEGCTVFVPFQDPENVGAIIRSAVAFGATQVVLLEESAHPFHPKAIRASGGAVLQARLRNGPALKALPSGLPIVPLSGEGADIGGAEFPERFGFLPGIEGPGLPDEWRARAVGIPIRAEVESLNAATATAIALYVWARKQSDCRGPLQQGEACDRGGDKG